MRTVPALLLLLLTVPLLADNLEIQNAYPSNGSVRGGDLVTIEVTYTNGSIICDPFPCDYFVEVWFGDVKARKAVNLGKGIIQAITPPHARGTVPISVELLGEKKTRYDYTFIDREDPFFPDYNYETVVIPTAVSAPGGSPGAFGTLWKSELWVTNRGAFPVELFLEDPRCAPNAGCRGTGYPFIAAGEVRRLTLPPGTQEIGRRDRKSVV